MYRGRIKMFSVNRSHFSKKWDFFSPKCPLEFLGGINEPLAYGDPVHLVCRAFKIFLSLSHFLIKLWG